MIGQQLRRLLNRPIEVGEKSLTAGASIGVAVYPDDATEPEDLLKNADLALYHAKSEGRGRCRHFSDELGNERQRRMVLSGQLRGAIENGDIQAYFQPLVRARDMRVVGFETLGRWFHPEFGPIPPPEFVKLAEENGLINPLTHLIMRKAIEAAQMWPDDVRVSVNVSPMQINSELVDRVRDLLKETGLDPHRLELEVTEDVLDQGLRPDRQHVLAAAHARHPGRDGRFRRRLHFDGKPPAAELRPTQDRPDLHDGVAEPPPRICDRPLDVRAGA